MLFLQRLHGCHQGHGECHEVQLSDEAGDVSLLVHGGGQQEPGHVPHQVVPPSHDWSSPQQHEGDGDLAGK